MQLLIVVFGIFAFTQVQTSAGFCISDSDCSPDECCAKQTGPLIMSKRDEAADQVMVQPFKPLGSCRKFNREGEHCNMFDKPNGFCGCAAGLSCTYVRTSTRSMPLYPGYFHCARK